MQVAIVFLAGFVTSFLTICGGSLLFHYGIDGVAVFVGSFAVAAVTALIAANC